MTALTIRRRQETDLPALIEVSFINKTTDYQRGLQSARRVSTYSMQHVPVSLPVVMDDQAGKDIAERLLYNQWLERNTFTFRTTIRYAWLEPTDVIQVKEAVSGTIYTMRILNKTESRNGEIEFEATAEHYQLYVQRPTTGNAPASDAAVTELAASRTILLDVPVLSESDVFGVYTAMNAENDTGRWRGGTLYKSIDGSTFNATGNVSARATTGVLTNALGNWTGPNVFDEKNHLNVELDIGGGTELTSADWPAVLNGANAIAVKSGTGWEILQYRSATLEMDGSYTLRGLLRGRKGTEWATGGHAIGDTFVLLNGAVAFATTPSSELGLSRQWKGVTNGQTLTSVTPFSFTNTGVCLVPYAPCHIGGGRNAANDVLMSWKRRTRIGGSWRDYADAPLSEASELYELEIWDSSYTTLKRTITGLTSASYTYSAADQTTDFGSPQSTVYVKVFQISATRGRGYEAKGSM